MTVNFISSPNRAGLLALSFGSTALAANAVSIFTDFGEADSVGNWNNISEAQTGSVADAIDSTGASTGISIAITSRFNGTNTAGTTDAGAAYPSFATRDSFFGNADAEFSGVTITSASLNISGLSSDATYDFKFFGSRTATDDRGTLYTVTGANSGSGELNVSSNVTNTASINGISPDGSGSINLVVSKGSTNTNSTGFFYLGVMEINSNPVPEPGSAALLVAALGIVGFRRRR